MKNLDLKKIIKIVKILAVVLFGFSRKGTGKQDET